MADIGEPVAPIDQLLDRAVRAVNRGDITTARDLAAQVLAADASSVEAAALLTAGGSGGGEMRRLALLFCDLVGSTELSARHEPELYRALVMRYTTLCREVVDRYHGLISHIAGDGVLAVFGLPTPHENDAERAVRASLDIVRGLGVLSAEVQAVVGERLEARAAVHRGLVFLDPQDDEIYGLAANVASRLHGLAAPGTVVISAEVRAVVGALFETEAEAPQRVKGVAEPLQPFRVVAERPEVPARGRRWAGPLVGRAAELGRLRHHWITVREEPRAGAVAVHVVGEAGIGKSRLVGVFADTVAPEAGACLHLLGSPFHTDAGFHAVRTVLEARCRLERGAAPDARLRRLRRHVAEAGLPPDELVPLLAPLLDIPPEAGYRAVEADSDKLRGAIAAGAARYLLACLGSGPALLIVDDLHWCDDATVDVIARVIAADRRGLLVLSVSREDAPPAFGPCDSIALAPLDDAQAAELVRSVDGRLDVAACRAVVARGDGVPLFLEELARSPGARDDHDDDITPVAVPSSVPDALYEPLVARLHATGPGVQVAAAAATIGRDLDRRMLARVADLSPDELDAAVAALVEELVLEPVAADVERYRFRHDLVRVVAYDLQPPSERRRLHARAAEALVADAGTGGVVDWRLVAAHHGSAGQPARAATAYRTAADGARGRGGLGEARRLLSRAIDQVASLPDDAERRAIEVGLRLRRGFLVASSEGNSSPDAVHDYERCLELAVGLTGRGDDGEALFSTLIPLYGYYMVRGDLVRAEQVAGMLRASLADGRRHYEPDNDAALGMVRWYAGDFDAARARLEASVAGLHTRSRAPDYATTYFMPNDGPASAHANLAVARFMRGDLPGTDAELDAARARCASIDFPQGPFTAAFTESYAAWTLIERGDLGGATDAVGALTALADRHGFDLWSLIGATEHAAVLALSALAADPDDLDALTAHAETVEGLCAAWTVVDLALFLPFFIAVAGRLRAAAGDHARAEAGFQDALRFARTTGIHFYDAEVMRLRAALAEGDDARAQLRTALALAHSQGAAPFELRIARDLLAQGDRDALGDLAVAAACFPADAHLPELDAARSLLATAG